MYAWMLALHSLSLSKSLISSQDFSELIASVTNVWVIPLDLALANLALLSLVRSAAVSMSVNHSSNFVKSYSLKTVISYSSELVRFTCFCVVHNVFVYWCIASPKGSVGVGVEVGYGWSMRDRLCSSHSMQSKPSAGWPSPVSTNWCKSFISLVHAVNLAWLLDISSLR